MTEHAIKGARDELLGLKENIIIGHLIPAGTGEIRYEDVAFKSTVEQNEDDESEQDEIDASKELEEAPEAV